MAMSLTIITSSMRCARTADARGRGTGGGGFGGGRVGGMSMRGHVGGGGGFAVRSLSGPRLGGSRVGVRSFSGPRIGRSGVTAGSVGSNRFIGGSRAVSAGRPAIARLAPGGAGNRFVTASRGSLAGPGTLSRNVTRAQTVLGNRFIINPALRSAIAPLWPYVYDDFWPYAYDDIYYGIYGAYAYYDPRQSVAPRRRRAHAAGPIQGPGSVCGGRASELSDWPIGRIAETVQPTDAQRAEFHGETMLFAWPSRAKLLDYGYDRESAMWSRDALDRVLGSWPTPRLAPFISSRTASARC